MMDRLPIDPLLPRICQQLALSQAVVVQAAPGAGKTTRVPASLLDADIAAGRQIVVLEPRRIAARAAAEIVARQRGTQVGGEVGYQVRFERKGTDATRLWFLTEGLFTRLLVRDPFLERVGAVVLDEFHERHLQGDFALAAVIELQRTVRPDLKLVVMSATLESEKVATHLGGCPVLRSDGRAFPVTIEYLAGDAAQPLAPRAAAAVRRVLDDDHDDGDVLVFLPGAGEIRRVAELIESTALRVGSDVLPLHGDLPLAQQYEATRRGARRRVILATNVAETALTVEGVSVVIDSGLARVGRFDAKHGLNRLVLARISRAAADQRAGRAGRLRPGRCVRLWSASDHQGRLAHELPEVARLDLSEILLEVRAWGLAAVRQLAWLDVPGEPALRRAENLLHRLGALLEGDLSEVGRRMLRRSLPPRLARMMVCAEDFGCEGRASLLAALASEREICAGARAFSDRRQTIDLAVSDLLARAELFEEAERDGFSAAACRHLGLEPSAVRAVDRARRQLLRRRPDRDEAADDAVLRCVLAGFPDRVVRRREPGSRRGVMVGGKGVVLAETSAVREADLFVAVELDGGTHRDAAGEALVRVASGIDHRWLGEMFPGAVRTVRETAFDEIRGAVIERRRTLYEDLVLSETVTAATDAAARTEALLSAARADPWRVIEGSATVEALLDRLNAAALWFPDMAFPTADEVVAGAAQTLCSGARSIADARRRDALPAMLAQLTYDQRRRLERELPDEYRLPNGRAAKIRYPAGQAPVVSARIQEVFGLTETPRVARGRVAVVFELLAPNHRPAQVTDDLASFWRNTYAEVRKQLRGRYPKHAWPEDPFPSPPLRRVRGD